MKKSVIVISLVFAVAAGVAGRTVPTVPTIDISADTDRQVVIAEGAVDRYEGHPTTLLADDGKTMFCVWTTGHGGPCGQMARSDDGGLTWKRLDATLPAVYARTHRNCPTLQKLRGPDGKTRYFIYSAKAKEGCGLGIMMSDDLGCSWRELPFQPQLSAGMPPTGVMALKNGTIALFGQVFKDKGKAKDRPTDDQAVWMAISKDGGQTYGEMRLVMQAENRNLCEPCCLRSPDGKSLVLIARENRHQGRSMMAFSHDEGATWSAPVDAPWALTGDRHEGVLLPDGRYIIAFRDRAIGSTTHGQFVAWVGTFDDLQTGREGKYRIRLLNHHFIKKFPGGRGDTGYSGVELLPDGTIVCTTYSRHFADNRQSSVVSTRFKIDEIDRLAANNGCRRAAMEVLPLGSVRAEGWLREQLEKQAKGLTGHAEELYDDIGQSDWLTGAKRGGNFAWERGPYYAKGLTALAFVLDDDNLKAKAKRWVDAILAGQRENGDFGPRNRNWWANIICICLLRDWVVATGDERIIPFLKKYFRFQREEFKTHPLSAESKWAVARAGDEMEVVLWLYNREQGKTGCEEWLEFAWELSRQSADWTTFYWRGGDPAGPNANGCRSHIVNFMQGLKTPALQYLLDGDERKLKAYNAAFDPNGWLMRQYGRPDRMVNGSEPLADQSASQGTELCAIAERIVSCQSILAATANITAADDMEIVAYNSLPATLGKDGKGIRYYCVLNQPACKDEFLLFANNAAKCHEELNGAICPGPHAGFGCCRSNFHMAWPKFVQSMWMRKDGGFAVIAYGPSRLVSEIDGKRVEITTKTEYPFDGKITLAVNATGRFPIFARIPQWTKLPDAGKFRRFEREWKNGDTIELDFPMEVKTSFWGRNAVAIQRGPVLFAQYLKAKEQKVERYQVPFENRWIENYGGDFPRKTITPESAWGYALKLNSAKLPQKMEVVGKGRDMKIVADAIKTDFGGWGYMQDVVTGRAVDPPFSPLKPEKGKIERLEFVPMATTEIRIVLMPWMNGEAAKAESSARLPMPSALKRMSTD